MAYNFTDEDKAADTEFKERIPFGVSEVKLLGATAGVNKDDKDYIELTVVDKDGLEDSARVWFTGGASPYSFQTIRQIVVHTAAEADKEKARMAVENCKNTDELADLLNSKCEGKLLWFTKYYHPTATYLNKNNETRRSINTSVYGYEPKLKPELMPEGRTEPGLATDVEDFPLGGEKATGDAAANIPSEWN